MQDAIRFSNTAMTVEKLANVMNRKNSMPQMRPPIMLMNTLGSVMKIRLGPASGEMPNEKHAGKMMSPAQMATKVSSTQMRTASPVRVKRRSM